MAVKIKIKLLFTLIFCALLLPGIALAQSTTPSLVFEGDVTIEGYDAPVGTVIVAEVDGVEAATNAPEGGIAESGKYMLVIQNEGYTGKIVVFKVDGIVAGEHEYISSMDPIVNFNLYMQTSPPAGGTDDSSGIDNTIHGEAGAFLSGFLGLGAKAIIGIAVGAVALVILLIMMIKRHRRYI